MTATAQHHPEVTSDTRTQSATATCPCGWERSRGWARPTGRQVAEHVVRRLANQHQQDPEDTSA